MRPWFRVVPVAALIAALPMTAVAQKPPPEAPAPRAIQSTADALDQTSAIVEGTVSKLEYTTLGRYRWTIIHLGGLVIHRGSVAPSVTTKAPTELTLRQVGGMREDGRQLVFSNVVPLREGERYLLFLRNTSWNMSPAVGGMALRVVDAEKQMLVGPDQGLLIEDATGSLSFTEPAFEKTDLNGQAPKRDSAVVVPDNTVDVQGLLALVDGSLQASKAALTGQFFDEPTGPFAEDIPVQAAEREPGQKDVQPGVKAEVVQP